MAAIEGGDILEIQGRIAKELGIKTRSVNCYLDRRFEKVFDIFDSQNSQNFQDFQDFQDF
ncbi:hypothetical protein JJD41_19870 [Oxynema sp. CENA135]|uniref:hypothetical protein n=1 Tax=Oxynema sp. CENA135 TaxID=984206 RepID=UPI00190E558B|nr:hypothetical protein [Oxynema sp. CENA135]MBK4732110.1 hypothetical protein [Oxynema sp. CENA135]